MHREYAHGRIEEAIGERQPLSVRIDGRWEVQGAPLSHGGRRLNGCDVSIGWLVRARASTDIEHCAGIAERAVHERGYPRVGYAVVPVDGSD
jgi:hypothetical protein